VRGALHAQKLGDVHSLTSCAGELADLRTTAETVSQDRGRRVGLTYRGEKSPSGAGPAHLQVATLEAEVSGQAAAARVEPLHLRPSLVDDALVGIPTQDCVVMAVDLRDAAYAVESGWCPTRCVLREQLSQRHRLLAEALHVQVVAQQFGCVGTKNSCAAWLEADDQSTGTNMVRERVDGVAKDPFRGRELAGRSLWQYFDQSMTTAVFVHCPAKLVPPPRDSKGALCSRHTATASAPASTVHGRTTPTGNWRKFDASMEYAPRLPASKRTSPSTRAANARCRDTTSIPGVGGRSVTGSGNSTVAIATQLTPRGGAGTPEAWF
jgi:hypothetical protein